ncbi:MAG: glycoside hydrolase family 88 protein [Pseudomonadota bacterium]
MNLIPYTKSKPALFAALILLALSSAHCAAPVAAPDPGRSAPTATLSAAAVLGTMERAADWQLAHPSDWPTFDWTQAVGYSGMMALAGISGQSRYRDAMVAMGERRDWKLGPDTYHADDQIVGQTYAELYLQLGDPRMIAAMRAQFDGMLAQPHDGSMEFGLPDSLTRWTWCDALFMAPPAWMRLYAATGDQRYMDLAVAHWWRTSDYLYDKSEHLYFRDSSYFNRREANGQKVFWSRGNGWVMGGLVRMLQYLPAHHAARARFEQQFKEMADRLVTLQQEDGMWRASLLDPEHYPLKETSGTGLYTYALAWGVNQGLLERARFEPALRKGWAALNASVLADGRLIHVQPIGKDPKSFDDKATEVYGVGAFLLAGSEIYRMALLEQSTPQGVSVVNGAAIFRAAETVEAALGKGAVAIMDAQTSRIVNSQADGAHVLFQATLAPGETRRYFAFERSKLPAVPPLDRRAHARFVPERFDDFAWESERIAHRVYGPAIMTEPGEKLTSSGVDVWAKSAHKLVIDNWYKSKDYHADHGEGLDFYSVGTSRGCGGLGVYDGRALHVSSNFKQWTVLADGPLRAAFELRFGRWDASGRAVSEVRRVSIDAGSNFSRVESRFESPLAAPLQVGVGIAQRAGGGRYTSDAGMHWMSYWEPQHGADGTIGCGVVLPMAGAFAESAGNYLALGQALPGQPFVYYLGAGWSKSGDFSNAQAWEAYVQNFAARVAAPVQVRVEAR